MFTKSRKEKFVEQAQDLAHDITEAITPHVERASDELGPRLADARDQLGPRDRGGQRRRWRPRSPRPRTQIAPQLADARDQAAPYVESARERIVNEVVPAVQQAVSDAKDQAGPRRRGGQASRQRWPPPPSRASAGQARAARRSGSCSPRSPARGAFVCKKLRGGDESANWQTSYAPKPAPAAPPAPPSPVRADGRQPRRRRRGRQPVDEAGDPTGANPGEALADAAEEPHPVTTPDAPGRGRRRHRGRGRPKKS